MSKAGIGKKGRDISPDSGQNREGAPLQVGHEKKVVIALGLRVPDADKVFKSSQRAGDQGPSVWTVKGFKWICSVKEECYQVWTSVPQLSR